MKKAFGNLQRPALTAFFVVCMYSVTNAQITKKPASGAISMNVMPMNDTSFINKNIMDNIMEIKLSQMGITKSTDTRIKSVSQQMVLDHTQILNDLRKAAKSRNISVVLGDNMSSGNWNSGNTSMHMKSNKNANDNSLNGGLDSMLTSVKSNRSTSPDAGTETTSASSSTAGTSSSDTASTAAVNGIGHDMNGMSGMSKNSMAGGDMTIMQLLQNATGAEFNTLYISQMLAMHNAKLAELEAAATTLTDPELKLLVTKAMPKISMHKDMLSRINKGTNGNDQ